MKTKLCAACRKRKYQSLENSSVTTKLLLSVYETTILMHGFYFKYKRMYCKTTTRKTDLWQFKCFSHEIS